ncbi:glucosamine inositolphosphorylceramide transferase 1-like isoform X2 [Wolffia australiana]
MYLFFETKNSITMQGDIGVARSRDNGSTWQHLGIILDEPWHLSYPFVFSYRGQVYLMPEGSKNGDLRLYRAVDFPLKWTLEKVILERPLIDTFMVEYQSFYWLFGSDWSSPGAVKNGQLEIWYSSSPFGPYKSHAKNPVKNTHRSLGSRNAGRSFVYNGSLYRPGQDCGETYGRRVRLFKILSLTTNEYRELEVPLGVEEPRKGRNAWNGARYHQLDAQQLSPGRWIAVMDGDRVPSGERLHRLIAGYSLISAAALLVVLAALAGCLIYRLRRKKKAFVFLLLGAAVIVSVVLACTGLYYLRRGSGGEEAYPVNSGYSKFTLSTVGTEAKPEVLRRFIKRYSKCPSVGEVVIVSGERRALPSISAAVPVRFRIESEDSSNLWFRADPLTKNRAVLFLDVEAGLACNDLERGFSVWRRRPERIVGFFPGLAGGDPATIREEKLEGYNMVVSRAAFVDWKVASARYWSERALPGRKIVARYKDCEDVLLNLVYANESSAASVEYVRPVKAMGGWQTLRSTKLSAARRECISELGKVYGGVMNGRKKEFGRREDGWDR